MGKNRKLTQNLIPCSALCYKATLMAKTSLLQPAPPLFLLFSFSSHPEPVTSVRINMPHISVLSLCVEPVPLLGLKAGSKQGESVSQ